MRIRHVIAGVGKSAPRQLQDAHAGVLTSVRLAARALPVGIHLEIFIVGFPDEPAPEGPWTFVATEHPPLGEFGFNIRRRLPLLSDLVRPLQGSGPFDIGILTNADIELTESFYERILDVWSVVGGAVSITRTNLPAGSGHTKLVDQVEHFPEHPGHDCFVAPSEDWSRVVTGSVALGIPGVMKPLLWGLGDSRTPLKTLHGTRLTVHRGDDRAWSAPGFRDYAEHNDNELRQIARDTSARLGEDALRRAPSIRAYLDEPPNSKMLIFALSPGRSGSESLARLFASVPGTNSGHEREPMVMGPYLRMTGFEGMTSTRVARRFKARAIEVERELFPEGIYVDTSHLFLYTFGDIVLEHFTTEEIVVIRLHRDPLDVVRSYMELGFFSRRNTLGPDWHFWPTWPKSFMRMHVHEVRSEWDLAFGSMVDFYRRQADFLETYKERLRVVPIRTHDLSDPAWHDSVLGSVGLGTERLPQAPGIEERWNHKGNERVRKLSRAQVEEEFQSFLERFGIDEKELAELGWHGPF